MATYVAVSNITELRNALIQAQANSSQQNPYTIVFTKPIVWSSSITDWPKFALSYVTIDGQGNKLGAAQSTYTINLPVFGSLTNCTVKNIYCEYIIVSPSATLSYAGVLTDTAAGTTFVNVDFVGCSAQAKSAGLLAGWLDNCTARLIKIYGAENKLKPIATTNALAGALAAVATPPLTVQDIETSAYIYRPTGQTGYYGGLIGGLASRGGNVYIQRTVSNLSFVNSSITPTYTRSGTAYGYDGLLVTAGFPKLTSTPYGLGIIIEPSGTNLISGALSSSTFGSTLDGAGTVTASYSGWGLNGSYVRRATKGASMSGAWVSASQSISVSLSSANKYTFSAYVRAFGPSAVGKQVYIAYKTDSIYRFPTGVFLDYNWQRVKYTFQLNSSASSIELAINLAQNELNVGDGFEMCMPQFEVANDATTFMDGSRSAETLTVPISSLLPTPAEGTIDVLFYHSPALRDVSANRFLFGTSQTTSSPYKGVLQLLHTAGWNGQFAVWMTNATGTSTFLANDTNSTTIFFDDTLEYGWHVATVKWNANNVYLYIDGQLVASGTTKFVSSWASGQKLYIGSNAAGADQLASVIAAMRVSNFARTDADIAKLSSKRLYPDAPGVRVIGFTSEGAKVWEYEPNADGVIGTILTV
jgi:hypothetical protein